MLSNQTHPFRFDYVTSKKVPSTRRTYKTSFNLNFARAECLFLIWNFTSGKVFLFEAPFEFVLSFVTKSFATDVRLSGDSQIIRDTLWGRGFAKVSPDLFFNSDSDWNPFRSSQLCLRAISSFKCLI